MTKTDDVRLSVAAASEEANSPVPVEATRTLRVRFVGFDPEKRTVQLVREAVGVSGRTRMFPFHPQVRPAVYGRLARGLRNGSLVEGAWISATLLQGWDDERDCLYLTDYSLSADSTRTAIGHPDA